MRNGTRLLHCGGCIGGLPYSRLLRGDNFLGNVLDLVIAKRGGRGNLLSSRLQAARLV